MASERDRRRAERLSLRSRSRTACTSSGCAEDHPPPHGPADGSSDSPQVSTPTVGSSLDGGLYRRRVARGLRLDVTADASGQPPPRIELRDEPVPRGTIEEGSTGYMPATTSVYLLGTTDGGPDGQANYWVERPS